MAAPLDLDLLRTFIAVVECGSFSGAAPRVGRSQSAVSMQIGRLEDAVGKQLLVRGTKKVAPNAVGTQLLAYARRLLKLSDEAWSVVSHPEECGYVRLGIPDDYATFLPPLLEKFGNAYPRVTVDLICDSSSVLTEGIHNDRIDLAVVTRSPGQSAELLRREPMVWVSSPTHAPWQNDPLPVALFQTLSARANVLKALADSERGYRCAYSSASLHGLVTIVQAGLAVAGLALCSVPSSVKIVGEAEDLPALDELEIGLLRNARSVSTAVQRLYEALCNDLKQPQLV